MKYELTNETIVVYGRALHRVKALKDIGTSVKKGDLGGFIEGESNLSQKGDCWVYSNARVYGNAEITKTTDVFSVTPIGSGNDTTTFYKAKDGKIFVKCGCKNTDIDTWLGMVQKTHGDNKHAQAYKLAAQIAKLQILGKEEKQ